MTWENEKIEDEILSEAHGLVRQSRTGKTETQRTATLSYKTQEEKILKFPYKK